MHTHFLHVWRQFAMLSRVCCLEAKHFCIGAQSEVCQVVGWVDFLLWGYRATPWRSTSCSSPCCRSSKGAGAAATAATAAAATTRKRKRKEEEEEEQFFFWMAMLLTTFSPGEMVFFFFFRLPLVSLSLSLSREISVRPAETFIPFLPLFSLLSFSPLSFSPLSLSSLFLLSPLSLLSFSSLSPLSLLSLSLPSFSPPPQYSPSM